MAIVTSRFAPRRSVRIPHSRLATMNIVTFAAWGISTHCIYREDMKADEVWIDRRRMAREIRREYQSIARDIERLERR
jgi:hypothetical protein